MFLVGGVLVVYGVDKREGTAESAPEETWAVYCLKFGKDVRAAFSHRENVAGCWLHSATSSTALMNTKPTT